MLCNTNKILEVLLMTKIIEAVYKCLNKDDDDDCTVARILSDMSD